ncbi:hypothetical protein BDZ45DRAFT_691741 [Acephala macrosclerotiorum]|nr:hypothetical protein BDZ45DRAFT_691741 [Acephala macrosclerotiorum]
MEDSRERPRTPPSFIDSIIESRLLGQHYSTSHKTAVRTVVWWENRKKPLDRTSKIEIFEALNVTCKRGYEMLSNENDQPSSRTYHNQSTIPETRGRKPKISKEQADMMEDIIENCDWERRTMS